MPELVMFISQSLVPQSVLGTQWKEMTVIKGGHSHVNKMPLTWDKVEISAYK